MIRQTTSTNNNIIYWTTHTRITTKQIRVCQAERLKEEKKSLQRTSWLRHTKTNIKSELDWRIKLVIPNYQQHSIITTNNQIIINGINLREIQGHLDPMYGQCQAMTRGQQQFDLESSISVPNICDQRKKNTHRIMVAQDIRIDAIRFGQT